MDLFLFWVFSDEKKRKIRNKRKKNFVGILYILNLFVYLLKRLVHVWSKCECNVPRLDYFTTGKDDLGELLFSMKRESES